MHKNCFWGDKRGGSAQLDWIAPGLEEAVWFKWYWQYLYRLTAAVLCLSFRQRYIVTSQTEVSRKEWTLISVRPGKTSIVLALCGEYPILSPYIAR